MLPNSNSLEYKFSLSPTLFIGTCVSGVGVPFCIELPLIEKSITGLLIESTKDRVVPLINSDISYVLQGIPFC